MNITEEIQHKEIDASDITSTRVVILIKNKSLIGFVTWDDEEKTLEMVRVDEKYRRKGYGTYLVQLADQYAGCTLRDNGYRSPEGTALLKKMNRRLARRIEEIKAKSAGAMMFAVLNQSWCDRRVRCACKKQEVESDNIKKFFKKP